ncbi:rhoptry neck protein RON5 [Toxoplasma gondii GT1]|nr:rhoptry neck protein RON5 [Toxoplasma gondii GT1]KFH17987.1 rhoptry neck protein RON5 [Toxoplasma gondii MAS]RQX72519.1 rhoptry neck protein RON5 [Toxoplasma gondii CAST]
MAEFTWRPLLMSLPKMIAFFHILLFSGALAAAAGSPAADLVASVQTVSNERKDLYARDTQPTARTGIDIGVSFTQQASGNARTFEIRQHGSGPPRPAPRRAAAVADDIFGSEDFSPPPMNVAGAPLRDMGVHFLECQATDGKIECTGQGAGARPPFFRGGVDPTEIHEIVQSRTVGPADYDEERPEQTPDYLSPTDVVTLQRFVSSANASNSPLLEDPVQVCLSRRKPTYTCHLLHEFAATSVIVEESGNLVCEDKAPLTVAEKRKINDAVKAGRTPQATGGQSSRPPNPTVSPSKAGAAPQNAASRQPVSFVEQENNEASMPTANTEQASATTEDTKIASAATDSGDYGEAAAGESAQEGDRPPPYNPDADEAGVPRAVQEAYEEARPLQEATIDKFKQDAAAAAEAADHFAQVSAFNAMQSALTKISAGYHLRAGSHVVLSACKRLVEAVAANPPGPGTVIPLEELRMQLVATLTQDFALAQAFIDYAIHIVHSAIETLTPQMVANALLELSGIEELINHTARVKSRLAARGQDSPANVRKEIVQESFRQLKVELFQEIVTRVCELMDDPESFLKTVPIIVGTTPTAPLRTGGHLGADYIIHLRNDLCDVTASDAQIFPSAPADEGLQGFPRHNLGERLVGWMDVMARTKTARKEVFKIIDFTKAKDVLLFASETWKARYATLQAPAAPAPSFYGITSSGCRNVNDIMKSKFFDMYLHQSGFMKLQRHGNDNSRQRFMHRVTLLQNDGILPQLPLEADYELMELNAAMQKNFVAANKSIFSRRAARHSKYGYLDLCDVACYQKIDRLHNDVMTNVFFSLDTTLMKIVAKVHRSYGIAKAFFQLGARQQHIADPNLGMWARRLFVHWASHNEVKQMQGQKVVKVNYENLRHGEFTLDTVRMRDALVRYTNMLKADPITRDLMSLVIHTWIHIRGVRNAAMGFKNSQKLNESMNASAIGAVFAKLWYESDISVVAPHQELKPFGAPLASMALQIGFFLHTVVEEYKMSLLEKAGAQIKSWFVGMFQKNKRRTVPRTWKAVVAATNRAPKVNLKAYQGALLVIKTLAKMFRERFLYRFYMQGQGSKVDFNTPTLLIHALVASWMDPSLDRLELSSRTIPNAKKLFWYYVWVNENGPSNAATRIVLTGCKKYTFLLPGVVRSVTSSTGEVVEAGSNILKIDKIILKRSSLEAYMNHLQATYDDPLTIVQVALDLAARCEGYSAAKDQPAQAMRGPARVRRATGESTTFTIRGGGVQGGTMSFVEAEADDERKEDSEDNTVDLSEQDQDSSFVQLKKLFNRRGSSAAGQAAQTDAQPLPKAAQTDAQPLPKVRRGGPDVDASAVILGSRFMLDLWCSKYRKMLVEKLSGISTKDATVMQQEISKVFSAVSSIKIAIPDYKDLWDFSLRCDWMDGYPDAEKMRAARAEMVTYAMAKASTGKRLKRMLQKVRSWIRKKAFAAARKLKSLKNRISTAFGRGKPPKAKVPDWAVVNAGMGMWTGKVFSTHLTFNEDEMSCNGPHEPIRVMSWKQNHFTTFASSSTNAERNYVLVKKGDDSHCWATREALVHKGWSGIPVYQYAEPAGFWLQEVSPSNQPFVVNWDGYLTTSDNLTLQDIDINASSDSLKSHAVMRIVDSNGKTIYQGPPTGVVQTQGGVVTLGSIRNLVSGVHSTGDSVEVRVTASGPQLTSVADLDTQFKEIPDL